MHTLEFVIGPFAIYAWFDWLDEAPSIEFIPVVHLCYECGTVVFSVEWLTFGIEFTIG